MGVHYTDNHDGRRDAAIRRIANLEAYAALLDIKLTPGIMIIWAIDKITMREGTLSLSYTDEEMRDQLIKYRRRWDSST